MQALYQAIRSRLRQAAIDNPDLEARLFLKHVTGVSDAALIAGDNPAVPMQQQAILDGFIARRVAGEPLSRILGEREFWGLPFRVTPDVLDPRPNTETMIETALKSYAGQPPPRQILDLGTGSGCILIALLHEFPESQGIGIDLSIAALAIASENARRNHVDARARFVCSNWAEKIDGLYDLILSNPPYIRRDEIPNLAVDVRNHDPILALDGGDDGLQAYKIIVSAVKKHLAPGGIALLEIGFTQAADVARLAVDAGLAVAEIIRDLGGHERVLKLTSGDSGDK